MTKMHAKIPKTRFNELANAGCGALYLETGEGAQILRVLKK